MAVDRHAASSPPTDGAQREAQQHDAGCEEEQGLAQQRADRAPQQHQDRKAEHRIADDNKRSKTCDEATRDQGDGADEHGDRNQHATQRFAKSDEHQRDGQANGTGCDEHEAALVARPGRKGCECGQRRAIGNADTGVEEMEPQAFERPHGFSAQQHPENPDAPWQQRAEFGGPVLLPC